MGPGAQLSTFSGWTIGPRTVGPWGRNPPTDTYPPIVGRIYPIGPGPEYVLTVDGYQVGQSNVSDAMAFHDGQKFSTK